MRTFLKDIILLFNSLVHCDNSPKVVYYHDIGTKYTPMGTPETLFWAHMEVLGKRDMITDKRIPHQVCFDDGFRGVWDNRETLRMYEIYPTIFLAIALIGHPGYLTWDEIRTLQNDYGFNFQCHTWSHQTLIGPVNTDLPSPPIPNFRTDAWYRHELVDSKNELEHQLNLSTSTPLHGPIKVDSLCFPVGYFSDDVIQRCAAAGYTNLYASFPGNIEEGVNSFIPHSSFLIPHFHLIPRILCQFSSLFEFKLILKGGMNPLRNRYILRHYIKDSSVHSPTTTLHSNS